jgi:hypothetical protein
MEIIMRYEGILYAPDMLRECDWIKVLAVIIVAPVYCMER